MTISLLATDLGFDPRDESVPVILRPANQGDHLVVHYETRRGCKRTIGGSDFAHILRVLRGHGYRISPGVTPRQAGRPAW